MRTLVRDYVSPIAAVITLATGIALVAGVRAVSIMFSTPVGQEALNSPSEKHDFFSTSPVAPADKNPENQQTELFCYDPQVLVIWQQLKKEDEFKNRVGHSSDSPNCSEMLELHRVDLNRDGKKEILVRGKNFQVCGAVGNCAFWIFEETKSRPRILISAADYVDISELGDQVLRTRTNGYSDILLKGHFSASETAYYTYKFDGQKYIQSRCMYEIPKYDRKGEGAWELITCKEFIRRSGINGHASAAPKVRR